MATINLHVQDKINLLLNQAYIGRTNNLPNSIEVAKEALILSQSIDDKLLVGRCLNQLSLFYMINS